MRFPLIKPYITEEVKKKVCEVLDSGYLTEGPVTYSFETKVREYIGCKHIVSSTSCTTGLEMALRALKIGYDDEVIVPDFTYPATASVVNITGATAVLVDVSDKKDMLIDFECVEKAITEKTRAIIPVSLFGNPIDYDQLNAIKNKYGLYVIEDAACSLGAEYNDEKIGNQADITVFSLHPRKFITTGEGGLIATNNKEWADWLNSYKHFGMNTKSGQRNEIQFDIVGTNYKLSNVLAAIGLAQMNNINELLKKRRELAINYNNLLKDINGIQLPSVIDNGKHSYQSYCIFVNNRDIILRKMREAGIEVQIGTYSLHMHPAFLNNDKAKLSTGYTNSLYAYNNCLCLPLYDELSFRDQKFIVDTLSSLL